jgi:hypothetical protein
MMDDQMNKNDPLAQVARRDADRDTPPFSEALHARLMRAVRSAAPPEPIRLPLRMSPWLPAAAAAVLIVAAGFFARWMGSSTTAPGQWGTGTQPTPRTTLPSPPPEAYALLDDASREFHERAARLQGVLAENQWAGLDHDVKSATSFLLNRLPIPAQPSRPVRTSTN